MPAVCNTQQVAQCVRYSRVSDIAMSGLYLAYVCPMSGLCLAYGQTYLTFDISCGNDKSYVWPTVRHGPYYNKI